MKPFTRARAVAAVVTATIVAGCGWQPTPAVPQVNALSAMVQPQAGPAPCKGQKNSKGSSSAVEKLLSKDGSLCIPTFSGLGGALAYPAAKPAGQVTVTSTTIDNNFPYPGSGTPVFYMEIALKSATTFGSTLRAATGLTGKKIKPKTAYTVFTSYLKYGFWYSGTSCYTTSTSGKFGGVIPKLGSALKGQSYAGPYTILLEVYPMQQSGTAC